jgi:hypothetical protein
VNTGSLLSSNGVVPGATTLAGLGGLELVPLALGASSRVSARAPAGPATCRSSSSSSPGGGARTLRPVPAGSMGSAPGAVEQRGTWPLAFSAHRAGTAPPARSHEERDSKSYPPPPRGRLSAAKGLGLCSNGDSQEGRARRLEATAWTLQRSAALRGPPSAHARSAARGRSYRPCPGRDGGGGGAGAAPGPQGGRTQGPDLCAVHLPEPAGCTGPCGRGGDGYAFSLGPCAKTCPLPSPGAGELGVESPHRAQGDWSCPRPGGSVGRPSSEGTDATHASRTFSPQAPARRHPVRWALEEAPQAWVVWRRRVGGIGVQSSQPRRC